jgi:hypothetical protein
MLIAHKALYSVAYWAININTKYFVASKIIGAGREMN